MTAELPQRFEAIVGLGRDGDSRVLLARDRQLDRPVRVVVLDRAAPRRRRIQFIDAVRAFAAVKHPAVADVYTVQGPDPVAYAVLEWHSGVTLADRLAAGDGNDAAEMLTIGASLASALGALHRNGVVHGALDASAVELRGTQPRLQGAWRSPRYSEPATDVVALAAIVGASLSGGAAGAAAPSQLNWDVAPAVDHALRAARRGRLDAVGLAAVLAAAVPRRTRVQPWNWRWLTPAALLFTIAMAVITVGLLVGGRAGSRLLFPAAAAVTPRPPPTAVAAIPVAPPPEDTPLGPPQPVTATPEPVAGYAVAWDPFGDHTEHDSNLSAVADGDPETGWETERYFDPLPTLKSGVGFAIPVTGVVGKIELTATAGTRFELRWATTPLDSPTEWERLASASITGESLTVQVPLRRNGWWLVWLVDVPAREEHDGFAATVYEVRFSS